MVSKEFSCDLLL